MKESAYGYPRGCNLARVIPVIETLSDRGSGKPGNPVRTVKEYWDFDGNLLATCDPYLGEMLAASETMSSSSI